MAGGDGPPRLAAHTANNAASALACASQLSTVVPSAGKNGENCSVHVNVRSWQAELPAVGSSPASRYWPAVQGVHVLLCTKWFSRQSSTEDTSWVPTSQSRLSTGARAEPSIGLRLLRAAGGCRTGGHECPRPRLCPARAKCARRDRIAAVVRGPVSAPACAGHVRWAEYSAAAMAAFGVAGTALSPHGVPTVKSAVPPTRCWVRAPMPSPWPPGQPVASGASSTAAVPAESSARAGMAYRHLDAPTWCRQRNPRPPQGVG